ncbi:LIM/homeobox protein Lhx3-like [Babylonia areolata]|uniref:LIM/homeobox protein Lhx3-like n=1 Tax=Babylonia areolata TaxID=304850 RepID=UPI003FD34A84
MDSLAPGCHTTARVELNVNEAGSSPSLPVGAALPPESDSLDISQFPNGPPPCTGCGQPILDQFIMRVKGLMWHAQCLRCTVCHEALVRWCFVHGTQVFCRLDFFKLFGAGCAGCNEVLPPTEVVRTAYDNVYHLKCFSCVLCGEPFDTGDEFYMRTDAKLLCRRDYHAVRDLQAVAQASGPAASPNGSRLNQCHGQQQNQPVMGHFSNLTFTPQETEVLLSIYRACPNPSHDMLQRISSQHGLDVTRVRMWFHLQRKERGRGREEGPSYRGTLEKGMERVVAPPGGYPLPIVNEVSPNSSGRLPSAASRSDVMGGDVPFPVTSAASSSCSRTHPAPWPLSEDVWRSDFVPPNVDLKPGDIQNGEVCSTRRGLPSLGPDCRVGATRGQCLFMSSPMVGKGGNSQQDQMAASHGQPLSWISS